MKNQTLRGTEGSKIISKRKGMGQLFFPTLCLATAALCLALVSPLRAATSAWVSMGACHLGYKTDANGNKVMDYSGAGYEGGGVALPVVPVAVTLTPVSGDNTANIQNAINNVSAMSLSGGFRGAVLLEPGTYNVANTLNITSSGVVLRGSGSGSGGTVINMTSTAGIQLLNIQGSGSYSTSGSAVTLTDPYVPSGAVSFNVNSSSGFAVGDTVLVRRLVTQAWVDYMNMNILVRDGADQTWLGVGAIITTDRVIKAINGNNITLDVPLTDSFDSNYTTGTMIRYTYSGRISQVGIENFSVVAPADSTSVTINADAGTTIDGAFTMNAIIDSWAQNIAFTGNVDGMNVDGHAKRITLRNLSINHTAAQPSSAAPADFTLSGSQLLFDNCSTVNNNGFWAFVTQSEVTGPNVLLNCSATNRGFSPHQRWATGLLADNCEFGGNGNPSVGYDNLCEEGSGHGWVAGWSVAWNCGPSTAYYEIFNPPGVDNWCIGAIGTEHAPTTCAGITAAQGIYDSLGTNVTLGSYTSLYLAQLADRTSGVCASPTATPTKTNTPVPPTATRTLTATATATRTFTASLTPTATFSLTPTVTRTSTLTLTTTPTPGCTPSLLTPYVQVNGGAWVQSIQANLMVGDTVQFGPQPVTGGTWSWTGPNGFTASTRAITLSDIQVSQAGNYTATFNNDEGCSNLVVFQVTVQVPTQTPTNSFTFTSTATFTLTSTNSAVPSATPTDSMTPMASLTATASPSPTSTFSPVPPTSTPTSTWTMTGTFTPTSTRTFSSTPTSTATFTSTFTASATPSATVSSTSTASSTPSWTRTFSPTVTRTATPTVTRTFTATLTATRTPTPAPSGCSGVAAWNGNFVPYAIGAKVTYNGELYQCIQAHTSETTWMPTVTPALWRDLGPCTAVKSAAVFPNPSTSSSTVQVAVPLTTTSDVTLQVYTTNFRKIIEKTYPQSAVGTDLLLELKGDRGENLANGLYYIFAQAQGKHWTIKLLVLR